MNIQVGEYLIIQDNLGRYLLRRNGNNNPKDLIPIDLLKLINNFINLHDSHAERCHSFYLMAMHDPELFLADVDRRNLLDHVPNAFITGFDQLSPRAQVLYYMEQWVFAYNLCYNTSLVPNDILTLGGILP